MIKINILLSMIKINILFDQRKYQYIQLKLYINIIFSTIKKKNNSFMIKLNNIL